MGHTFLALLFVWRTFRVKSECARCSWCTFDAFYLLWIAHLWLVICLDAFEELNDILSHSLVLANMEFSFMVNHKQSCIGLIFGVSMPIDNITFLFLAICLCGLAFCSTNTLFIEYFYNFWTSPGFPFPLSWQIRRSPYCGCQFSPLLVLIGLRNWNFHIIVMTQISLAW